MRIALLTCLLLAAGCVGTPDPSGTGSFLLAVDDAPLDIVAPSTTLVQLVVIGADGEVTIEAEDLPSFGALDGSRLTFTPGFDDAGDYAIELTARSGMETSSATMHLHVTRVNTAPYWVPSAMINGLHPSVGDYPPSASPSFSITAVDDEGDAMTLEVEAVPAGAPSTMTMTHSVTMEPNLGYYASEEHPNAGGAELVVPLTGLAPGQYDVRVRVLDDVGAVGDYAWNHFGGFTQL